MIQRGDEVINGKYVPNPDGQAYQLAKKVWSAEKSRWVGWGAVAAEVPALSIVLCGALPTLLTGAVAVLNNFHNGFANDAGLITGALEGGAIASAITLPVIAKKAFSHRKKMREESLELAHQLDPGYTRNLIRPNLPGIHRRRVNNPLPAMELERRDHTKFAYVKDAIVWGGRAMVALGVGAAVEVGSFIGGIPLLGQALTVVAVGTTAWLTTSQFATSGEAWGQLHRSHKRFGKPKRR